MIVTNLKRNYSLWTTDPVCLFLLKRRKYPKQKTSNETTELSDVTSTSESKYTGLANSNAAIAAQLYEDVENSCA